MLAASISLLGRGPVKLQNIRYYSYPGYTRVVLDLSASIKIVEKVIKGGDSGRLFFDLKNCRFAADYPFEKKNSTIMAGEWFWHARTDFFHHP